MKYAVFNEQGLPIAFYDSDIHSDIPQEAVEITNEQWLEFISNQGRRAFINGEIIDISNKVWDGTEWRKKTEEEILNEVKQQVLNSLASKTQQYIEQYYPDVKQRSDIADKEYFGGLLLTTNSNYTASGLYKQCTEFAKEILDGDKTLQDILSTLPEDEQPYWEQLIKVAVRVGWVQMCKQVYATAVQQVFNATSIEEVNTIQITFPEFKEV